RLSSTDAPASTAKANSRRRLPSRGINTRAIQTHKELTMANIQLVKPQQTITERATNGHTAMAPRSENEQVKAAARLVLNLYELTNQAPLSKEQLHTRAMHWAGALLEAGIPPRRWDEVATLARKFRPSASKAFAITADQVLDVWDNHI